MRYKPHVDGLRTVAVLPVILFHLNDNLAPGGYTGVDIFFVISGYLITGVLMSQGGEFSIIEFYRRRILRIFPLFAVIVMVALVAGYFILLPIEFTEVARSAAASAVFQSNLFFMETSNYFDSPAIEKPLLHTWSLSVEEQFYLFYPLFLMLIGRFLGGRYRLWVGIATALSLAANVVLINYEPSATFYLPVTRAWELGAGALLALGVLPHFRSTALRAAGAALGLGLVAAGMIVLNSDSLFPGWNALFPVVGTVLLLHCAPGTSVGTLLSLRPIVYVGMISYALYLWHWPVLVFFRLVFGSQLNLVDGALIVGATFVLAVLSRQLIEQPFRYGLRRVAAMPVIWGGIATIYVLGAVSVGATVYGQIGRVFPPDVLQIAQYSAYRTLPQYQYQFDAGVCFLRESNDDMNAGDLDHCMVQSPSQPDLLILGDSHAAHLWRALSMELPEYRVLQATSSGCRPLLNAQGETRCVDLIERVLHKILPTRAFDLVILAGRWKASEVDDLVATVRFIEAQGDHVVVIGPTVEYRGSFPHLLAQSRFRQDLHILDVSEDTQRFALDASMKARFAKENLDYISVTDVICPQGACVHEPVPLVPMHFDYGHLTLQGALYVARHLRPIILDLPAH